MPEEIAEIVQSEIVEQITDAAEEIIEEQAERTEIAEEINRALLDSIMAGMENRLREEFEARVIERVAEISEGLFACQNELERLRSEMMSLSSTATAAEVTAETALETAETSLTLQVLNPQNEEEADPASQTAEAINPENQESQPEPAQSAQPLQKRIRRLL